MTRDPQNLKLFIKGNHLIAMDPRSKLKLLPVNNTFAKLGKSAKVILPDNNLLFGPGMDPLLKNYLPISLVWGLGARYQAFQFGPEIKKIVRTDAKNVCKK